MSDLRNRLGHALHLCGEAVPLGENSLMLGLQTTIRFERLQDLDPFGKPRSSLVQAIPREGRILHFATRYLYLIA